MPNSTDILDLYNESVKSNSEGTDAEADLLDTTPPEENGEESLSTDPDPLIGKHTGNTEESNESDEKVDDVETKSSETSENDTGTTDSSENVENSTSGDKNDVKDTKTDPVQQRFNLLAKKEREFRAEREKFQRERKETEKTPVKQPTSVNTPLEALRASGFNLNDLNEYIISGGKEQEVDPIDEKLKPFNGLRDEIKVLQERLAQRDAADAQTQYDQRVAQNKKEIKTLMTDNPKYDMMRSFGDKAVEDAFETMVEYYNTYEKVLTFDEACDMVEGYYEETFMPNLLQSEKLKAKMGITAKPSESRSSKSSEQDTKKSSNTLTNKQGSATGDKMEFEQLSDDEKLEWLAKNRVRFLD